MSTYPEPLVARALGVKKSLLADTRKARLAKGADWAMDARAQVAYTAAGLAKLCRVLGLDRALVEAAKNCGEPMAVAAPGSRAEASAAAGGASLREVLPAEAGGNTTGQEPAPDRNPVPAFARRDPAATVAAAAEELARKSSPVWVEVTGVPGNPIIVHGRLEGRPVTVRVRANATFVPGLWIQATPLNGANYFAMVGHPPRWKGDRHGFARPAATDIPPANGGGSESSTGATQSGPDPARAGKGVASAQAAAPALSPAADEDADQDLDGVADDPDPTNRSLP